MVGNDIVDIGLAKKSSNWTRSRFLDKLFTKKEQQLIFHSENSFNMVWRLWSMKEAAYKLFTQLNPDRFYNPKQFACSIYGSKGNVKHNNFQCYINTKITAQYIVSEASLYKTKMASNCIHFKNSSYKTQSDTIKQALLLSISERLNILNSELRILKSEFGIPSVYQNSKELEVSISISHHGLFGAYVIT